MTDNWVGRYPSRFCEVSGILYDRTDDITSFTRSLKDNFDLVEEDMVDVE